MGDTRTAIRALAHPGSVLALVVLLLNDHVLKQAWPGVVTGKLSDVAGLVVFPLLLAVPLAAVRVRRPLPAAVVVAGAGFLFVKASAVGAGAASAVWSAGLPTTMRADPTDLLAMPALTGAWWIDRQIRSRPATDWRRTAGIAAGMAVLPIAVLATAATNCIGDEGVVAVYPVSGRFTGSDLREAFVVDDSSSGWSLLEPTRAESAWMAAEDSERLDWEAQYDVPRLLDIDVADARCDGDGLRCWRLRDDRTVEVSEDAGATWGPDLALSEKDQEELIEGVDPGCTVTASADLSDLSVLGAGDATTVAVNARHAGVWFRDAAGRWTLVPRERLGRPAPTPAARPRRGKLGFVVVRPLGTEFDEPSPSPLPTPFCASPTTTTVTPNPRNGPPTTYEVCP
jgi:hypothetical protein